jgi:hypothetical protein
MDSLVVRLLCAKSKISPLKGMTIARLELQSALMLAKLVTKVRTALTIKIDTTILWSDSIVCSNKNSLAVCHDYRDR